jgi:hypothetical protein
MKTTYLTIAALSAITAAAPAVSQTAGTGIETRVDQLQARLDKGIDAGSITRDEAAPLREQLRTLRQTERTLGRNGWTSTERRDMQSRIQNTREQIRVAERNQATRYGSNTGWIDRNNDGWDDRDANRDGRLDSGYTGQGGPLEELPACTTRSGLGGIIGNIFGAQANTNCILQPGQRATGNLYGVPVDLRNQYRDGNGVYYRSDGNAVYQIDSRTNLVTRVYDID